MSQDRVSNKLFLSHPKMVGCSHNNVSFYLLWFEYLIKVMKFEPLVSTTYSKCMKQTTLWELLLGNSVLSMVSGQRCLQASPSGEVRLSVFIPSLSRRKITNAGWVFLTAISIVLIINNWKQIYAWLYDKAETIAGSRPWLQCDHAHCRA